MSLDAQPNIPRRSEMIQTPEAKAKKEIEATLAELDTQFGAADVNLALQAVFVGDETLAQQPKSLSYLRWKLDVLNTEIGEDIVTAALYDADKLRNPPIEPTPEPARNPDTARESDRVNQEMIAILTGLSDAHPDAFEIWGDEASLYDQDEISFKGTDEELEHAQHELALVQQLAGIAHDSSLSPDERAGKFADIHKQLYPFLH